MVRVLILINEYMAKPVAVVELRYLGKPLWNSATVCPIRSSKSRAPD